jgi:hypothetical protein
LAALLVKVHFEIFEILKNPGFFPPRVRGAATLATRSLYPIFSRKIAVGSTAKSVLEKKIHIFA